MRKLIALCAVSTAAAVFVPATVSAAPVNATLSGTVTSADGFLFLENATVEGEGTVPSLGRVSFVAYWSSGCFRASCTSEGVELTAKNGNTLALGGSTDENDSGGLIVPWSAGDGTGRFASISGSGTFSFNFPEGRVVGTDATVVLTGTLSR